MENDNDFFGDYDYYQEDDEDNPQPEDEDQEDEDHHHRDGDGQEDQEGMDEDYYEEDSNNQPKIISKNRRRLGGSDRRSLPRSREDQEEEKYKNLIDKFDRITAKLEEKEKKRKDPNRDYVNQEGL